MSYTELNERIEANDFIKKHGARFYTEKIEKEYKVPKWIKGK